MFYFVVFSLRIRSLSPEFFLSVPGKVLYESLLTKAFKTMVEFDLRNGIISRKRLIQFMSLIAVTFSLTNFTSSKNHGPQEKSS